MEKLTMDIQMHDDLENKGLTFSQTNTNYSSFNTWTHNTVALYRVQEGNAPTNTVLTMCYDIPVQSWRHNLPTKFFWE